MLIENEIVSKIDHINSLKVIDLIKLETDSCSY